MTTATHPDAPDTTTRAGGSPPGPGAVHTREPAPARTRGRISALHVHVILLLLIGTVALLPGLDRIPMTRAKELRVVLTAREMVESGNWLVPIFEGHVRLQKPPLMYWVVGAAMKAGGTTRSALVARLPAATLSLLLVLAIYFGGRYMLGPRRGFLAGLVMASSLIVFRHGRLSDPSMLLALCMVLASLSLFSAVRTQRIRWWVLAGGFMGLGFLAKGPAALVIPLGGMATWLAWTPNQRSRSALWGALGSSLLAGVIAIPWYVFMLLRPTLEGQAQSAATEEMRRVIFSSGHTGSVFYYLGELPAALLPWGVLLPVSIWFVARTHRHRAGPRFILSTLGFAFVLLTAMTSKQSHYALLLVPFAAWVIGLYLDALCRHIRVPWARLGQILLRATPLLAVLLGLVCFALPAFNTGPDLSAALVAGILLIIAGFVALLRRSSIREKVVHAAVLTGMVSAIYPFILYPMFTGFAIIPLAMQQCADQLRQADQVYFIGRHRPAFEFYGNRIFHPVESIAASWEKAKPGDVLIVADKIKTPIPMEVGAQPLLSMERRSLRCVVYLKGDAAASPGAISVKP